MATDKAAQIKLIMPFLDRAEEIERVDPKTAYYSRMTAVTEGMKIEGRDPAVTTILGSVMGKLEATKATANVGDEALDTAHVTQFCLKLFTGADRYDRAGKRDEGVLKRFMHCKVFFKVLASMTGGVLDPKLDDMRRYAAMRAVQYGKAFKLGNDVPPPPELNQGEVPTDAEFLAELDDMQINDEAPRTTTSADSPPPSLPITSQSSVQPSEYCPANTALFDSAPVPQAAPHMPPGPASGQPSEQASGHGSGQGSREGLGQGAGQAGAGNPLVSADFPAVPHHTPAVIASPADEELLKIFQEGCKVLYREDVGFTPQPGTIVRRSAPTHAKVVLSDRVVTAYAHQVAPNLAPGARTIVHVHGKVTEAQVVYAATHVWPPRYTVEFADGHSTEISPCEFVAIADAAAPAAPKPSPLPPADLPSIPATLPGNPTPHQTAPQPGQQMPQWDQPPQQPPQQQAPYHPPPQQAPYSPAHSPAPPPASAYPSMHSAAPPVVHAPSNPAYAPPTHVSQQAPPPPVHAHGGYTAAPPPIAVHGYKPSTAAMGVASKKAREVVSSLNFDDVDSAVAALHAALAALTQPP